MTHPTEPRDDQSPTPHQPGEATPSEATSHRPRRWVWLSAAVGVALAVGGVVAFALVPSTEDKAVEFCQDAIRGKLRSPSTAVFGDEVTMDNSAGVYRLAGTFDAQNGFGATVRGTYRCVLRREGDGRWVTTEATLTSR